VRLITTNQSGTAVVTAFSGGASARLENLRVGTAAVERVILSANPQNLGPLGGSSEISARVEDVNGLGVTGVPVTFTTTQGTLSPNPSTTDPNGVARTTLTTTQQARVNANVAGKTAGEGDTGGVLITLTPRTGIKITAPTNAVNAGQPASFTVGVATSTTPPPTIRDVTISWGDGQTASLGAISADTVISHIYFEPGTYTVTATATDASNNTERVSTSMTVLPAQPPTVTVTAAPSSASVNQNVRLTAQVCRSGASLADDNQQRRQRALDHDRHESRQRDGQAGARADRRRLRDGHGLDRRRRNRSIARMRSAPGRVNASGAEPRADFFPVSHGTRINADLIPISRDADHARSLSDVTRI
jgi:hypothetical protein